MGEWRTLAGHWWRNEHNQVFYVIEILPFGVWVKWAKVYPQVEPPYTLLRLEHMQEFYPMDDQPVVIQHSR